MQRNDVLTSMLREIFFGDEIRPELEEIHSLSEYDYAQGNMKNWYNHLIEKLSKEELSL